MQKKGQTKKKTSFSSKSVETNQCVNEIVSASGTVYRTGDHVSIPFNGLFSYELTICRILSPERVLATTDGNLEMAIPLSMMP